MKLSGQEYQQLQRALLSAFPKRTDLQQMLLFQLGESLDAIVSEGNISETIFDLIQWSVAHGRLGELIAGARNSNAGNTELRTFVEQVWQAPAPDPSQPIDHRAPTPNQPATAPADSAEHERLKELLAIQRGNLHKLERQAALHGSIDVPLILLNQLDEVRREITKLEAQLNTNPATPPASQPQPTVRRRDPYSSYETAMDDLLRRLGTQHVRYDEALTYQQRLRENIDTSRRYGDTETTRAGRAQIVGQLNSLAQDALGVSFNQLM